MNRIHVPCWWVQTRRRPWMYACTDASHLPTSLVHQELVALAVGPRKRAARGSGVGEGQLGARHHVARNAVAPAAHARLWGARRSR